MISGSAIGKVLTAELASADFTRRGSTWRLIGDEVVAVVNLQKSRYSQTYFLNIGFWIRELGENTQPQEHKCHVRSRAGSLWASRSPSPNELLSEDSSISDEDRIEAFRVLVREELLPLMIKGLTKDGLSELVSDNMDFLILRVAWPVLGIECQA